MKLGGYRLDGTLRVLIPGGLTVILRDDLASPPLDEREADQLGPWIEPPVSLSWQERQELAKRLDRSRVVPAQTFVLAKAPAPDEGSAAEEATESPDEEAAEPDAPIDKGALLETIKGIAAARAKEKAAASVKEAGMPRFGKKKFKLEYEVEDSQAGGEAKDKKKPPTTPVATNEAPDALVLGTKP